MHSAATNFSISCTGDSFTIRTKGKGLESFTATRPTLTFNYNDTYLEAMLSLSKTYLVFKSSHPGRNTPD